MSKILTVGEIMSKYKTIDHFEVAYTKKGKVLIDRRYLSWHYIKDIIIGSKKLINHSDVKYLQIPPR